MFLCDDCLKDSCEGFHLSGSFGRCEGCRETKETWDCVHYKRSGVEAVSLDQVRMGMLAHLRELAMQLQGETLTAELLIAKVECAREMCLIAGIPEAVVAGTMKPRMLR